MILILLFTLAWPTLILGQPAGGATTFPDHITLTWTGDPARTMTITWRTDTSVSNGLVQYEKSANPVSQRAEAESSDFTTDLEKVHLFTTTLTGLSPDTKYTYRVGDGTHWSSSHSFSTADPKAQSFKFLVFGDSQSNATGKHPYELWRKTIHNAYESNSDTKFIVNMGDLVDTGQSGAHWNAWFAAAAGVIDAIPEMPVVGNHETYGSRTTHRPEYWNAQFHLPQNGPTGLKNQAYSYDYGPVHFAELDSQQDEEKQYGDILSLQRSWLDADLSASQATWKIVLFHKTPYAISILRSNPAIKAAFCPIIERHHADLVFNGHDHGIARTYPMNGKKWTQKPSQGTIYFTTGRSGEKTYATLMKMPYDTFFYNPLDQPNYLVVEVTQTKLTIRSMNQDGTLIDTFFIDKSNDIDSDIGQD